MKIKPNIVLSVVNEIDGGMLFDLETGSYYRVNEVACFIVRKIQQDDCILIDTLVDCICEEYEVDRSTAIDDITSIIEELKVLNIVID